MVILCLKAYNDNTYFVALKAINKYIDNHLMILYNYILDPHLKLEQLGWIKFWVWFNYDTYPVSKQRFYSIYKTIKS